MHAGLRPHLSVSPSPLNDHASRMRRTSILLEHNIMDLIICRGIHEDLMHACHRFPRHSQYRHTHTPRSTSRPVMPVIAGPPVTRVEGKKMMFCAPLNKCLTGGRMSGGREEDDGRREEGVDGVCVLKSGPVERKPGHHHHPDPESEREEQQADKATHDETRDRLVNHRDVLLMNEGRRERGLVPRLP